MITNNSNDKLVGRIYESKSFGKCQILGPLSYIPENCTTQCKRYVIKFLDTGCITDASYDSIRHGAVRDYMKPVVAGVGYTGSDIMVSDPNFYEIYKVWNDMINRCHNEKDRDYRYYGAIGIKVVPRWFNFSIFAMDVKFLPNYWKKEKYPMIYQLDKDYLQLNIPKEKRVYSPETCMWLSLFDNTIVMNRDNENASGYYGVVYKDGSWSTRINGAVYGRFTTPEAAANLFNYLYPKMAHEFNDIMVLNNVPTIPYDELKNYCVGSTTIREAGVGPMWARSGSASLLYN